MRAFVAPPLYSCRFHPTFRPPRFGKSFVPGGNHFSCLARRGTLLRVSDAGGGANASLSLVNFAQTTERLNIPDTLKGQHTAMITRGHVLYSDMGRALCSLVEDTVGWHDALCGPSDDADIAAYPGVRTYADARNEMFRSARGGLLIELGKYGLGARDLGPTLNLFSKVSVEESGALRFHEHNSRAGDFVALRFEMDCLFVVSTAPHRLDPRPDYAPSGVQLRLERAQPVAAEDECRISCPQNARAFENTGRYYAGADLTP